MCSIIVDIWKFIKNPVVLMFLLLFGFIQMIVILATLNSNNMNSAIGTSQKPKFSIATLDWRFKTAIKVESESESQQTKSNKSFFLPEVIQFGSEYYQYPLLVDMVDLVERVKSGQKITVQPINDPKFSYIIREDICESIMSKKKVDLLILIKSSPSNSLARDVIRSTWGKLNCWGERNVKRVFLFGNLPEKENATLQQILMESATYHDVIQSDFLDNYYNNTYKMMLGLTWATTFCRNAKFLMFVDDDYFVQPRVAMAYLESISEPLSRRLVSGYVWQRAFPHRTEHAKWYTSLADYPWPIYPPYCSAGNFFLSMAVATDLSIAMRYTRYFRFDDVFLGIVLHKLLMVPMHLSNVFSFDPIVRNSSRYSQMLSSHGYKSTKKIIESWIDLNCASFCSS